MFAQGSEVKVGFNRLGTLNIGHPVNLIAPKLFAKSTNYGLSGLRCMRNITKGIGKLLRKIKYKFTEQDKTP